MMVQSGNTPKRPPTQEQPQDRTDSSLSPSDATQLDYGCVDWFMYDAGPALSADRPLSSPSRPTDQSHHRPLEKEKNP